MASDDWSRRSFLRTIPAGALAAALPTVLGTRRGAGRGGGSARAPSLPPRVVGLRTTGGNFRFDPVGLRLPTEASLVWLNMGDFHTATAFHPDNSHLLDRDLPRRIPEGAEPFHSGMLGLSDGTEFEYRFDVPGVYDYFCQPHYSFGMVGRVVVGDGGRGSFSTGPERELNEDAREQMPGVDVILDERGRTFEWAARLNGLLWLRANGEPAEEPFRAVDEGVASDSGLETVLGARAIELRQSLSSFGEGIGGGADYETLVGRADRAKEVLRRARRDPA